MIGCEFLVYKIGDSFVLIVIICRVKSYSQVMILLMTDNEDYY